VQNKGVDQTTQIQNFRCLISNLLTSNLTYALKAIGINAYLLPKMYFPDLYCLKMARAKKTPRL